MKHAFTGLSINQDIDSKVIAITDTNRLETICSLIQELVNENKDPGLDLRIGNEEIMEKIIRFQKKKTATELPLLKLTFYNTTTTTKKRS